MFHWKDGWYFERLKDGSVKIERRAEAKDDAPIILNAIVPPTEWASIVASVSKGGETDMRWFKALDFHWGRNMRESVETLEEVVRAIGIGNITWAHLQLQTLIMNLKKEPPES